MSGGRDKAIDEWLREFADKGIETRENMFLCMMLYILWLLDEAMGGDIYLLHILIINEITNDDTFNSLLDTFPHHRIHFSRFKKHYNQLLTFPTRWRNVLDKSLRR